MLRPTLLVLPALLLFPLGACRSLQFKDTELVETTYDPEVRATKVVVSFQLVDSAGLPVSDLEAPAFTAREDGVAAGEEAMARAHRELHPLDVAVLVDKSTSAYASGAIPAMKAAAERLAAALADQPCVLHLYSFARTISPLESLSDIPDAAGRPDEHWTSLYHAVDEALDRHPGGIVVVLTDGADNYSHNQGGPTLDELADRIAKDKRIVHAVGFGALERQHDRTGVAAASALGRLTRYGSYLPPPRPEGPAGPPAGKEAEAAEASATVSSTVDDLAQQIARRIPATYTFAFFSSSLAGEHTLRIEADGDGVRGTSPPIAWQGAGPPPGESR